jgi:putative ABC transport system permease protein
MGASNGILCVMLIVQSFTVGIIGFGIGMLATAGFGLGAIAKQQPPFYLPWIVLPGVFGVIVGICMLAALMGIWRVSRYEPAMVFRG